MARLRVNMFVLLFLVCTLVITADSTSFAAPINIFVSPSGSDGVLADGSIGRPFRTIERARQQANLLKSIPVNRDTPINVLLRAGRYALEDTLDFTSADSGNSRGARITYQAYCDPAMLTAATSRLPFPYYQAASTSASSSTSSSPNPPRLLWNGMGSPSAWTGPVDPFAQMEINKTNNSLLVTSSSAASSQASSSAGSVCIDKNNPRANDPDETDGLAFSNGHTCYANGPVATCVSGCMAACQSHYGHSDYPDEFTAKFKRLFGKDLSTHEDCIEVCALSCRGCERVELSGAILLPAGSVTNWRLERILSSSLKMFAADLSAYLPAVIAVPSQPKDFESFTTLFVNDTMLPRAGFPDCEVVPASPSADTSSPAFFNSTSSLRCGFAPVVSFDSPTSFKFDASTFSSRVGSWSASAASTATTPSGAETHNDKVVSLKLNASEPGALFYSLSAVDTAHNRLVVGGGGAEVSYSLFEDGFTVSSSPTQASFRVDNVIDELDAPGEWFFDASTRTLYLIPLDSRSATVTTLANSMIEIPRLHQLLRVSGTRANRFVSASHAHETLVETESSPVASHLRFRHLIFSGTQLHHLNVYERVPGSEWPMTRVAAVFVESAANVSVEHCVFSKIGGNALMVSGASTSIKIVNNNVSFVGSSGIAVLARRPPSLVGGPPETLLASRELNMSFNQVHHIGQRVAHSAALMVVGAHNSSVAENLVFGVPTSGAAYVVRNALGASVGDATPLIRPVRSLLMAAELPTARSVGLATSTAVSVPLTGFDVPLVAKFIGAPACDSSNYLGGGGKGRLDSPYAEPNAFTYSMCSGCCPVHANDAVMRVVGRSTELTHAQLLSVAVSSSSASESANQRRRAVVYPGQSLEIAAVSSRVFRSAVSVFIGFHVETPNQVLELPLARSSWRVETRGCVFSDVQFEATCTGPCGISNDDVGSHCGGEGRGLNSNVEALRWSAAACQTPGGYEVDLASRVCVGPFEAWADCSGTGSGLTSHMYYNCSITCRATTCV